MNTVKTELQTTPFLFNFMGEYVREKKDELKLMAKNKASFISGIISMARSNRYILPAVFLIYLMVKYRQGMF